MKHIPSNGGFPIIFGTCVSNPWVFEWLDRCLGFWTLSCVDPILHLPTTTLVDDMTFLVCWKWGIH